MKAKKCKTKRKPKKKLKKAKVGYSRKKHSERLFSEKFIEQCKQKLLQKHKELTELQKKPIDILFDEVGDEADIAVKVLGQEVQHELSDTQRNILYLITQALEKIERGEYGLCENCKKPIAKRRLEVLPWAKYCIECQDNMER